jgi:hypothetical protein
MVTAERALADARRRPKRSRRADHPLHGFRSFHDLQTAGIRTTAAPVLRRLRPEDGLHGPSPARGGSLLGSSIPTSPYGVTTDTSPGTTRNPWIRSYSRRRARFRRCDCRLARRRDAGTDTGGSIASRLGLRRGRLKPTYGRAARPAFPPPTSSTTPARSPAASIDAALVLETIAARPGRSHQRAHTGRALCA